MPPHAQHTAWLISLLLSCFFLSACAPAPIGSPVGLQQQLSQMEVQQQQQAEQLQVLQQQLTQLQQQLTGESVVTAQIESSISGTEPPEPQPPQVPLSAQREIAALTESASSYLAAFSDLATGRYRAAEAGFARFLSEFPDHQYTPNARFWLANAQASQGKLQSAMSTYRQLVIDPQAQVRAPAALFRMAQLYRRQNQVDQADDVLEQLRSRFPDSPEAQHSYRSEESQ